MNTPVFIIALGDLNEGDAIVFDCTDDKITCYSTELAAYRELVVFLQSAIESVNNGDLSSVDSEWAVHKAELTSENIVLVNGFDQGIGILDSETETQNLTEADIQRMADVVVAEMGDIFYDCEEKDATPPTKIASNCIADAFSKLIDTDSNISPLFRVNLFGFGCGSQATDHHYIRVRAVNLTQIVKAAGANQPLIAEIVYEPNINADHYARPIDIDLTVEGSRNLTQTIFTAFEKLKGESLEVLDPEDPSTSAHNCSFMGELHGAKEGGLLTVIDMDGNAFDINTTEAVFVGG